MAAGLLVVAVPGKYMCAVKGEGWTTGDNQARDKRTRPRSNVTSDQRQFDSLRKRKRESESVVAP